MDTNDSLTIVAPEAPPALKANALGVSRYDHLIEKLDDMSEGEFFVLPLPGGTKNCATFQSRVSAGLAPRLRAKSRGYAVKIRQLADDNGLAVYRVALPVAGEAQAKPAKKAVKSSKVGKAIAKARNRVAKKAKKHAKR